MVPTGPRLMLRNSMSRLCLAALCVLLYCSLTSAVPLQDAGRVAGDNKAPFTFDDIFNSSYQYKSFSPSWVGNDTYTMKDSQGNLNLYTLPDTENGVMLVSADVFKDHSASNYYVSDSLEYVLLACNVKRIWRHSFYATYIIVNTSAPGGSRNMNFPDRAAQESEEILMARWAPLSNALTFVAKDNNIYYKSDVGATPVKLTEDGLTNKIFNGLADWLYEEEILSTYVAHWWSPDEKYIMYAQFDDTDVNLFKFPYYGPKTDVYGDIIEFPYPKAGSYQEGMNSKATLKIIYMDQAQPSVHQTITPPNSLRNLDHYVMRAQWSEDARVAVIWANRVQNKTVTTFCDITTTDISCSETWMRVESNGWIDREPSLRFVTMDNGDPAYLTIMPRHVTGEGRWKHVALVSAKPGREGTVTFLTDGAAEVKSINTYDVANKHVYYTTTDGNPKARHIHRVGLDGSGDVCISCNEPGKCYYVTISFSRDASYHVLGCRGPDIPTYVLRETHGSYDVMMQDNAELRSLLELKSMPNRTFTKFPSPSGYTMEVELITPPGAESEIRKYPLLVETYAGPGSQAVTYSYSLGWRTYMASSEGVVYAKLDGRGTASRGEDYKHLLYRRLGTIEIEDQLQGGQYLKDNLKYLDSSKAAIWGWSYGGFATSHAVANQTNVYPCGIIGAALTDRRYYDTAHTERYMGFATDGDNNAGYDRTDVMRKVEFLRDKTFLVVHGTADDNVHFASSAQLVRALTEAEIQFRLQIYPDLNHYFLSSSRHAYRLFTEFLLTDCWNMDRHRKQVRILY